MRIRVRGPIWSVLPPLLILILLALLPLCIGTQWPWVRTEKPTDASEKVEEGMAPMLLSKLISKWKAHAENQQWERDEELIPGEILTPEEEKAAEMEEEAEAAADRRLLRRSSKRKLRRSKKKSKRAPKRKPTRLRRMRYVRRYSEPVAQGLSNAWVSYRAAYFSLGKLRGANLKQCRKNLPNIANGEGKDLLTRSRKAMMSRSYETARKVAISAQSLGRLCLNELKGQKQTKSRAFAEVVSADVAMTKALQQIGKRTKRTVSVAASKPTTPNVRCDLTVAQDGSGDVKTVQEGVNRFSSNSQTKTVCIKAGVYSEQVIVPEGAERLRLQGLGPVKITAGRTKDNSASLFLAATFVINAKYFRADDITFENSNNEHNVRIGLSAAPAISVLASYAAFFRCRFHGWTDTIGAIAGNQYYKDCYVEGLADFIYGSARAHFENTEVFIKLEPAFIGFVTAQGSDGGSWARDGQSGGFIFNNCKVTGDGRAYLGRPWRPECKVVFMNSYLDIYVMPALFQDWFGAFGSGKVSYLLYNNKGPQAANKQSWQLCNEISADEAGKYSVGSFIGSWM